MDKIKRLIVPLAVVATVTVFFFDVIFLNKSLTSSSYTKSTLPSGAFEYPVDKQISKVPVIDGASSTWHYQPAAFLNNKYYSQSKLPLWNPYIAAGQPLAADMQSASFYPLQLPVHFFQNQLAWDFFLLLRIFMAALFALYFLKELGLDDISCFTGAVLYALSGYLVRYINMAHLNVDILLPLIAFAFLKMFKKPKRFWPLVSFSVFLALIGGMPESAFLVIIAGITFYCYLIISSKEFGFEKWSYFLLSVFLGLLLS